MHRIQILALAAALGASGCFTVRHTYTGPKVMTPDAAIPGVRARKVAHFDVRDRQFFWIHGGFPVGEDLDGAQLAARQIGSHDGVVNLRIRDGQDLTDAFISHIPCVLTLICGTWSVWAEGDVVDFEEAVQ
jgi:hypothetical protein